MQAIKNLSITGQSNVNADGTFKISNLKSGKYGLLFIQGNVSDGIVYVYNDSIHSNSNTEIPIYLQIKEIIDYNESDIYFNFDSEKPDYFASQIVVQFKPNVSEADIEKIIQNNGFTIIKKIEWSWGSTSYQLKIPKSKTVLEVIRELSQNDKVDFAEANGISSTGED